ncbi:NAD(P)/FAD-dependent oxidoreductase [Chloroflexota bacterium]
MKRYVVIGSGAAGIAAAEAIRQRDEQGEIVMIAAEKEGYYSRPGLAYYLTGELGEKSLFPFGRQDFKRLKVRLKLGVATRIDPAAGVVEMRDGSWVPYDRALIAVGASAVKPDLPGIDLDGVVYLDILGGTRDMIRKARRSKSAVVVGGGITALEIVEGLRARRVKVHFLLRRDRYWGAVLDEIESRIVENKLREDGVKLHFNTEVEAVLGRRGKVSGMRTTDGREIKCQLAAFAIGVRPRLELAQASGLDTERGILVNEFLQTSQPEIYAAGDAAQVYDPLTGRSTLDSLWSTARQQGYFAGLNMTGQPSRYQKSVPFNVTRLAGLTTTIIGMVGSRQVDEEMQGIVRGESETWHSIPDAIACQSNFDVNRLRLLVGRNRLLGAVVMGNQTLSQPLQHMIAFEADITPIREQLLQPNANLVTLITNFWISWRKNYAAQQH